MNELTEAIRAYQLWKLDEFIRFGATVISDDECREFVLAYLG